MVKKIIRWQVKLDESKREKLMPAQAVELLTYLIPREKDVTNLMTASSSLTGLKENAKKAGTIRSEVVLDETLATKVDEQFLQTSSEQLK